MKPKSFNVKLSPLPLFKYLSILTPSLYPVLMVQIEEPQEPPERPSWSLEDALINIPLKSGETGDEGEKHLQPSIRPSVRKSTSAAFYLGWLNF